ncbi:unnamed protein product [Vicia faba]|uniref:Uncharacterized protein n=1 Tax=Vicia faba TaxID=3906 RepID=A0AAV1A248_VICFA|nr:unnamed protein product [Vicia faba]
MADDLFEGLPPPSSNTHFQQSQPPPPPPPPPPILSVSTTDSSTVPPIPKPILKSSLKRPNPTQSDNTQAAAPKKSLKFKTSTDASEAQVIDAMKKISSHINNPAKFKAAMLSPVPCTDPSVRADYHSLFSAAQDAKEHFNKKQKNQLATWVISAVVANDLYTDDSFVVWFSL